MFDISVLKEMKLPELQEIAKIAKIAKFKTLKKDDLVYQILDYQAANPETIASIPEPKPVLEEKPKRARIIDSKVLKPIIGKVKSAPVVPQQEITFEAVEAVEPKPESTPAAPIVKQRPPKVIRFTKDENNVWLFITGLALARAAC